MTTLAESSTRVLDRIAGTADLCALKPNELDCLASAPDPGIARAIAAQLDQGAA